MTPASEPATNRSKTLRVSLSVPIKRLIWMGRIAKEMKISERAWRGHPRFWLHRESHFSYLLIGHELEGRLGGDFDDVHAVAPP